MSRQFQFAHGNFNLLMAVSFCSRQFQFAHSSFNFAHGSFNFAHSSFNLLTAVSICSRQFQFCSRQFQFAHGSFNLLMAVSISLIMRLQWISANIGHVGCQVCLSNRLKMSKNCIYIFKHNIYVRIAIYTSKLQ